MSKGMIPSSWKRAERCLVLKKMDKKKNLPDSQKSASSEPFLSLVLNFRYSSLSWLSLEDCHLTFLMVLGEHKHPQPVDPGGQGEQREPSLARLGQHIWISH